MYFQIKAKSAASFSLYEFLIIWLAFSFYGAVFGGRPYEHYLIQAVAAFSLIAAATILKNRFANIGSVALALVIALTFVLKFQPAISPSYYPNFFRYISGRITFEEYTASFNWGAERNYALASFLRCCERFDQKGICIQKRTTKNDKIYVFY